MLTNVDGAKVKAVTTPAPPLIQALHAIANLGLPRTTGGQIGKYFWRMMRAGIWIGLVNVGHTRG